MSRRRRRLLGGGDLLAKLFVKYGAAGFLFDKIDPAFRQSGIALQYETSAGITAVDAATDPVGLVLDRSQGVVIGAELAVNGGFDADSNWGKGTGWAIGSGTASSDGTQVGDSDLTASIAPLVSGKFYQAELTVSAYSAGNVAIVFGTQESGDYSANGSISKIFRANGTALIIRADLNFVGSVDALTVREISGNHAYQVTGASRPALTGGPPWYWTVDKAGDDLVVTIPSGGITGTYIQATDWGVATYSVAASAGAFSQVQGGVYLPGTKIYAAMMIDAELSTADKALAVAAFEALGAVDVFGSVTNFGYAWRGCSSLTAFPLLDVSAGTNFGYAWYGCSSLTAFPLLDVSAGTNFSDAWRGCPSLTAFPLLDVSAGTNFPNAWFGCSSLTAFPLLDVSAGTNFSVAWYACSSLTAFPLLDVSAGTNFSHAWFGCSSLTTFPASMFNTSTATDFTLAFDGCALSATSVDNILVSIAAAGTSSGTLNITGGTSSAPSATGNTAIDALRSRSWTVTVVGGY